MARTRISTTVDAAVLEGARRIRAGSTDAALIDAALEALVARHRAAEIDDSDAAYDRHPVHEPDAWRDLAVLSRDAAIPRLGRALIAPCTTTIRSLPSEVVLALVERLGRLADSRMREICAALAVAVDCQG